MDIVEGEENGEKVKLQGVSEASADISGPEPVSVGEEKEESEKEVQAYVNETDGDLSSPKPERTGEEKEEGEEVGSRSVSENDNKSRDKKKDDEIKTRYPTTQRPEKSNPNLKTRNTLILAISILSFGIGCYFLLYRHTLTTIPTGGPNDSCMYWAGDHYQRVSCNWKSEDILVIALDSVKLNNLKRITEPDTITTKSIGRVWYVKVDGRIEFYTADGCHPIQRNKRLMPITAYIINKYIHHKPLSVLMVFISLQKNRFLISLSNCVRIT